LVLALELGAAVAIVLVVRSAAATPAPRAAPAVGVDTVADAPASFRSGELAVRGHVVERPLRVRARDRGTFVIGGDTGGRLLVVPADGARLPAFRSGVEVVVRGTVVIPPDSARLARRPATRTALAKRFDTPAVVKATDVDFAR
jgi:hypothetical protein